MVRHVIRPVRARSVGVPGAWTDAGGVDRRARRAVHRRRTARRGHRQHVQHPRHRVAGCARRPRPHLPAGQRHLGPAHRGRTRRRRRHRCRLRGRGRGRDRGDRADPAGVVGAARRTGRRRRRTSAVDDSAALVPIQLSVGTHVGAAVDRGRPPGGGRDPSRRPCPTAPRSSVGGQLFSQSATGISITELLGIVVAYVVLLITFASFIAAGLPLITALLGVGASLAIVLIGHTVPHDHVDHAVARPHARARGGHRLRAVHHLPASGPAEARRRPRGVRRPRGRDLGVGGRVRRDDGDHRAARPEPSRASRSSPSWASRRRSPSPSPCSCRSRSRPPCSASPAGAWSRSVPARVGPIAARRSSRELRRMPRRPSSEPVPRRCPTASDAVEAAEPELDVADAAPPTCAGPAPERLLPRLGARRDALADRDGRRCRRAARASRPCRRRVSGSRCPTPAPSRRTTPGRITYDLIAEHFGPGFNGPLDRHGLGHREHRPRRAHGRPRRRDRDRAPASHPCRCRRPTRRATRASCR